MIRVKARSHISQIEALFFFPSLSHSFCRRVTTPEKKELREIGKQGGESTQDAEKIRNRYSINLKPRLPNSHHSSFQEPAAHSHLHCTLAAMLSKRWAAR
jgi:hypothetical protein